MKLLLALASVLGTQLFPAWSPDGTHIAWMSAPLANVASPPAWQLWEAGADGSGAHEVTGGGKLSEGVDQLDWFAPSQFAVVGNFSVFVAATNGGVKTLAVDIGDEASHDVHGDRFAFGVSRCGQSLCPSRIAVLDRSTGKRALIGGPTSRYYDPTLSPDGGRVAFTSPNGLVVARTDGTDVHRIVSGPVSCPYWSPDGRRISYVGPDGSLRVVSPTGANGAVLVPRDVVCGYAPIDVVWAPDGSRVAVEAPGGRITIVDVATRKKTMLASFRHATGVAWSPDSARLLVSARPRPFACSSLWVVHADGSGARRVVSCGS